MTGSHLLKNYTKFDRISILSLLLSSMILLKYTTNSYHQVVQLMRIIIKKFYFICVKLSEKILELWNKKKQLVAKRDKI